jgi:hypothetical protein
MAKTRLKIVPYRNVADAARTAEFWYGVAAGFAAENYLLGRRSKIVRLAHHDPIHYAWRSVGDSLNQAISSFGCHEEETQFSSESTEDGCGNGGGLSDASGTS